MTEEQADEIIGLLREIRDEVKDDPVDWSSLGAITKTAERSWSDEEPNAPAWANDELSGY